MSTVLITSALPYINGVKHLGNLVGSLLPADVHARFRRQIGDEVLIICGTDEHGTPAELGASMPARRSEAFAIPSTSFRPTFTDASACRSITLAVRRAGRTMR